MNPIPAGGAIAWSPWSLTTGHCVSLQRLDAAEARSRAATLAGGAGGGAGGASRPTTTTTTTTMTMTAAVAHTAAAPAEVAPAGGQAPPAGGQAEALLPMLHITKPLSAVAVSAGVHATPRVNALLAHMVVAELHARWQHPRT